MLLSRCRRPRDESGATAIFATMVALLLFGFSALTVDLGNALGRKGDTQVQADFAALAGGERLPGAKAASDPVVAAVADYLWANAPQDDRATPWADSSTTVATNLVDGVDDNGEVYFPDKHKVRVVSPYSLVNFGFAGALSVFGGSDLNNINVAGDATAALGTPKGYGVWPLYVANPTAGNPSCDYGLQTLTDPPGGQVVPPTVPTLYADSDTNDNKLTSITVYDGGVAAGSVSLNSTTGQIRLYGDFKTAQRIGFFRSDDPSAAPIMVNRTEWLDPTDDGSGGPYTQNNGSVLVRVPTTVSAVDKLWWVRAYQVGTGATADKWSKRSEAQPLSVGDAPYECVSGSSEGNFGTLKLPRSANNSAGADGWIARNIALGNEAPLTLTAFPSPAPWTCTGHPSAVVSTSSSDRKAGTNCLDTDTGLTDGTATPGFITGYGSGSTYKGLLDTGASSEDPDGSGGCSPTGDTSPVSLGGKSLNNDLLTCFLTDDTTTLGDVARRNYAGGVKFDPAIYNSPRFGWVPVFAQETESGGSNRYSIVTFRPTFITDQPMTATKANSATNSSTSNGLGTTTSGAFKLHTLKVVFLNPKALPDGDASTPLGPVLDPSLPTVLRLID